MQCSKVPGSISTEEQAEAAASWAALDTLENAAHPFGQMPGSLLGQFSLSRAWFPSEGVKGAGWVSACCTGLCVFVLTSSGTHSTFLDVPAGCLVPCENCPDSDSLETKYLNPLV